MRGGLRLTGEDFVVEGFVARDDAGGAELVLGGLAGGGGHGREAGGVGEEGGRAGGHGFDVADFVEEAVDAVFTSSGTPPTRVAMQGTPQAMASRAARPKLSMEEGMSMRSPRGSRSCTLSCLPRKWMRFWMPCLRARCSARERSGPSPMSMSRDGTCWAMRAKTSTTSSRA